jgi:hypothetical protein
MTCLPSCRLNLLTTFCAAASSLVGSLSGCARNTSVEVGGVVEFPANTAPYGTVFLYGRGEGGESDAIRQYHTMVADDGSFIFTSVLDGAFEAIWTADPAAPEACRSVMVEGEADGDGVGDLVLSALGCG